MTAAFDFPFSIPLCLLQDAGLAGKVKHPVFGTRGKRGTLRGAVRFKSDLNRRERPQGWSMHARAVGRDSRDVESQSKTDHLLTVVLWGLHRLLNDEYEVTLDHDGSPERLEVDPDYGVLPLTTIEEDLKACLPWAKPGKLFALRNERTPEEVRSALAEFPFLEFHLGTTDFEKVLRADWGGIVTSVYWAFRRFSDDLSNAVIASRIGLGDPHSARLETEMQWRRPDALPDSASRYVVHEMSVLLPAAVERLRSFQVTPVSAAVPTNVAQYAREATRCYLYEFLSAALILCRSCIESGVEERLGQKGLRRQLNAIRYNKVEAMLNLALNSGVLDDLTFGMANDIRKSANKAVHGAVPTAPDCQAGLEQTRAVLRHLYE